MGLFRSLFDSLKPRFARAMTRQTRRDTASRRPPSSRPRLESLENRCLLSNYAFTDLGALGTLGVGYSIPNVINASGQVVGISVTTMGDTHAVVWNNGVITDLGTLGGPTSSAGGINDTGQVVGWAHTAANTSHAFLITPEDTDSNGTPDVWYRDTNGDSVNDLMLDLGTLGYGSGWSHDTNDSGQIAGNRGPGPSLPFLWTPTIPNGSFPDDGTFTDLPDAPVLPFDYWYSSAYGLNNAGDVVGHEVYGSYGNEYNFESQLGVLWVNGASQDVNIVTPTGGWWMTHFEAINDARQIVGYATNSNGAWHAALLTPIGGPEVRIGDVQVAEGDTGMRAAAFTVTLSTASSQPVTVNFATANGSAMAGSDYTAASGTLTIPAGQTTGIITILVKGDRLGEANETFVVNLSAATNGLIVDSQGVGTILDNEPRISISDVTRAEGKKGQTTLFTFTVTLSAAYDQAVTMSFRTVDGTAKTSDSDYVARTGTLTFAPGETTKTITIEVNGDSKKEANETFYLDLFGNSSNSLFTKNRGIGTILNDD